MLVFLFFFFPSSVGIPFAIDNLDFNCKSKLISGCKALFSAFASFNCRTLAPYLKFKMYINTQLRQITIIKHLPVGKFLPQGH